MIPVKLTLAGFLSYREPAEIDFTLFDLACISGANGAGKSSLLDAMTWALFGQARKRDDSLINAQSGTAEVSYTFNYEGNLYRVQRVKPRDKTTVLEFHIQGNDGKWKVLTERSLRATEAKIIQTLRLDYETFVNASFFLQGKADQFTQQRPADRKRILSSILGLEIWETYRLEAVKQRKEILDEITELDGRLKEINEELAEEEQRKSRLKELEKNLNTTSQALEVQKNALAEMQARAAALTEQEKLVHTLAENSARSKQNLEDSQSKLEERQTEKEGYAELIKRSKEIEENFSALASARKELEDWNQTAAQFNQQEKERQEPLTVINTEETRLEEERKNLIKQEEEIKLAQSEHKDFLNQQTAAQNELEIITARLDSRKALESDLKAVLERDAEARGEKPLLKSEMDDIKSKIEQLSQTNGAVCPICDQPLSEEERSSLITDYEKEGKEKGDRYRENQTVQKETQKNVRSLENDIRNIGEADKELREKTRVVDQFSTHLEIIAEQSVEWEQKGAKRLAEVETILKNEKFAQDARKALAKVNKELKAIGYDAAEHDAVRKRENDLRHSEEEKRSLDKAQAVSAPLEREIKELDAQIKEQTKEYKAQDKAHQKSAVGLAAAQAQAPDVANAQKRMLDLQEEENVIRTEVGGAQQKVEVLTRQKERLTILETEREELAKTAAKYNALERAFGKDGVPAMLIEQALPQIETKANEILERLSGGSMSIQFITQQAYKDTKREDLRETLEIQISDSAGRRDYEMYSGGEAFRINFAVRLSLSEVLAQRAGARLQTLIIDEGFGSQDEAGRQRLIEAIIMVKDDFEKILVITHIDSLKDAFPTRIEVVKTDRGSVVTIG